MKKKKDQAFLLIKKKLVMEGREEGRKDGDSE
jgi:hypothetical protein